MVITPRLGIMNDTVITPRRNATGLLRQVVEGVNGSFVSIRGQWVLNFAGTNYLGLGRHPALRRAMVESMDHFGLSLSMPRILATAPATLHLEQGLAKLVGQQEAMLFPSSTHALMDLLPYLISPDGFLFLDAWSYPISRQAATLARQRGARVCVYPHNDVTALGRLLARYTSVAKKAIVCDGVYSAGGGQARLREFAELAQRHGATVVVDDAHGLGVLGHGPTAAMPYGFGGGGLLLHQAAPAESVIYVGSLSKAFSVPLAFVAGSSRVMTRLRQVSGADIHSSPPAQPIVAAAGAALHLNVLYGDLMRERLLVNVRQFQRALAERGLFLSSQTSFPIQSLHFAERSAAQVAARSLRRKGIWTVLHHNPADAPSVSVLRFIVTRLHTAPVIARAAGTIAKVVKRLGVGAVG